MRSADRDGNTKGCADVQPCRCAHLQNIKHCRGLFMIDTKLARMLKADQLL